jgi:hypothetical protein
MVLTDVEKNTLSMISFEIKPQAVGVEVRESDGRKQRKKHCKFPDNQ